MMDEVKENERLYIVQFHLYEMFRNNKSINSKSVWAGWAVKRH